MSSNQDNASRNYSFKRIIGKLIGYFAMKAPLLPSKYRARLHSWRGIKFDNVKTNFIGTNVNLDNMHPELISIGENTIITDGAKILAHFIHTGKKSKDKGEFFQFYTGKVRIERNVFIGANTVITKPLTIGENSIIGANTVISKDIPPNSLVVGNPGKVIRTIFKEE